MTRGLLHLNETKVVFFYCAPLVYSELADLTDGGELCNPYFGLLSKSECEPQMQYTILTNILT